MSDLTRQPAEKRRRQLLKLGLSTPLLLPLRSVDAALARKKTAHTTSSATAIAAVRMWPSREYTRVTLELIHPLPFRAQLIDNPHRVTLDLRGLQLEDQLRELLAKVSAKDPFVRQIRVGQFDKDTMRIVFDLKQAVAPQVFTLKPAAGYKHRLVLDFYPKEEVDPLSQLIASANQNDARNQKNATARTKEDADDRRLASRSPEHNADKADRKEGNGTRRSTDAPRRKPAPEATRIFTVALDPGHGGEDPGAIGPRGTYEKDVVLAVAKKVQALLAKEENLRIALTRDDDYYVSLAKRVSKARGVRADLFVSIHADAFVRPDARGSSVFVLSNTGASSVGAKWLARKENSSDLIGGINKKTSTEAASLLLDLYTTSQIRDSRRLAKLVLGELGQVGRLHKASVEQANFAVLRAPDIPSILVETAFISNPDEEKRLRSPAYQDELARAIAKGILDYRRKNPPGPRGKMS
ncbi:MAG: N-acetylmuramoyl-L-alanine amidase [Lautropia sp.]|nr:N-acetylmuramoyl-L-alanine amidase [Lautropia sp.]